MTDIVERLRNFQEWVFTAEVRREAADEIERLRAQGDVLFASIKANADEIERLRSELEGKISQSYAAELARQVGELEAENKQLRARFVPEIDAASNS